MGKTGSVTWIKIKGRKGQTRLVASRRQYYKKPGPNQKYTSDGKKRRKLSRSIKSIVGTKS